MDRFICRLLHLPVKNITGILIFSLISGVLVSGCSQPDKYVFNEGRIYGTVYHIVYESPGGKDLKKEIDAELQRLNLIFSIFDPESQISKVNQNKPVELDSLLI